MKNFLTLVSTGVLIALATPALAQTETAPTTTEGGATAPSTVPATPAPATESLDKAGEKVKDAATSVGRDIKASACPVVADKSKMVYHLRGTSDYNKIMRASGDQASENRECFTSQKNAQSAGYKKATY